MKPENVSAAQQARADKRRGTGKNPKGYVKRGSRHEHRVVWEQANGPIPAGMIIHHRDENTKNNAIENLQLMTKAEHARHHTLARHAVERQEQDHGR